MNEAITIRVFLTVWRQLDANAGKSTTPAGQCRLGPLIPVILDCSWLYHFSVKLLFKLHSCQSHAHTQNPRPVALWISKSDLYSSIRHVWSCSVFQVFQLTLFSDTGRDSVICSTGLPTQLLTVLCVCAPVCTAYGLSDLCPVVFQPHKVI